MSRRRTAFLLALFLCCTATAGAEEELTLRVSDAEGVPGGLAAITLRTYASRPIGQGQVCLESRITEPGQAPALAELVDIEVFSSVPDVTTTTTQDLFSEPQVSMVEFRSDSASINASDGPLAAFFFRLADDLRPGDVYEIVIDDLPTRLVDRLGSELDLRNRVGELTVRSPASGLSVSSEAETTIPGGLAVLSFHTVEPVTLSRGRVVLHWDPSVGAEPPQVRMDSRYGAATFEADTSVPGRAAIDFHSADATLNRVPGDLIQVLLPTLAGIAPGTEVPVTLDPAETALFDSSGNPINLVLESGVLEFASAAAGQAGNIEGLRLAKAPGDELDLRWYADCAGSSDYAIYRGDLGAGYESLELIPGQCLVSGLNSLIPMSDRRAEFFLVVPHFEGLEGGYGLDSDGRPRRPAQRVCHPRGPVGDCSE